MNNLYFNLMEINQRLSGWYLKISRIMKLTLFLYVYQLVCHLL